VISNIGVVIVDDSKISGFLVLEDPHLGLIVWLHGWIPVQMIFREPLHPRVVDLAGFAEVQVKTIVNRYPVRYWASLAPAPAPLKRATLKTLAVTGLGAVPLPFPAGNLAVAGFKRPRA
jgi:hypothetical protein